MSRISPEIVDKLNSIPLDKVMEMNGYTASRKTDSHIYYCCPFHPEKEASFKIDRKAEFRQKQGDIALAGYHCFGCGEKGYGAIMLQAALMRKELKKDFRRVAAELAELAFVDLEDEGSAEVTDSLARLDNLVIDGDHKNGFFHRARIYAEPMDELCMIKKDGFTHNELRALGCQVQQVFRRDYSQPGSSNAVCSEGGAPVYKYSFGRGFYDHSLQECNFDPRMLTERFNLYALSGFITEKRWKGEGKGWRSYEVTSTPTYPIFAFIYEDKQGWWVKKYEPLFKQVPDEDGKLPPNYKFTWWYQGGNRRDEEMANRMYGDVDVMRAFEGKPVETTDDIHPVIEVFQKSDGEKKRIRKFKRIIICSGPRDAINVYFHSDAHVCFPHSENVEIPVSVIRRLREIANEVFILYDIDDTGIKKANRLAMRFLDLKVVYLPRALRNYTSSRTGKPCKDAEEYFNYFPSALKSINSFYDNDINDHFANMLADAKPMQFWDMKETRHSKNTEDEYTTRKYTMNVNNMNQFLSASGMYAYGAGKSLKFVDVGVDNVVELVEKEDATIRAKRKMKDYLSNNRHYNTPELSNAISDTKRLNLSNLSEMSDINLDFHSWGKDFDYLFFRNTAVLVTAEEIRKVPYSQLPYHVNREAIIDADFEPINMSRYFKIQEHPRLKDIQKQYEINRYGIKNHEDKVRALAELEAQKKIWKYQLVLNKPMEDMPPLVQFIYDIGRMFWRDEEQLGSLPADKQQFQDAHFVNKIIGLGYMLSRFRTPLQQYMVTITDYTQANGGKVSGGNGKTTFAGLLRLVRKGINKLAGKQFLTDKAGFTQNFAAFTLTVHSYVNIDDLKKGVTAEDFYNAVSTISVKNLYHDIVQLPEEESPKLIISMNEQFDITHPSTYRRLWTMYASDYYHDESYDLEMGLRSPATKFGYDILDEAPEVEKMFNRNLLAYALQLYFQYAAKNKEVLRPPIGKEGAIKIAAVDINDEQFTNWAIGFYENSNHFERPIAFKEMVIDYLDAIGQTVNNSAITKVSNDFREKMFKYCHHLRIIINPDVVYRKDNDEDKLKKKRVVRRQAWETVFNGDVPVEPRVRKRKGANNTLPDCYYFYHQGTVPREFSKVLHAPEEDPEKDKWVV